MRHRLFLHLTWTTFARRPLIDAQVACFLDRALRAIASQERARVLELGIVSTHVHLVTRVHPCTILTRLVQRLKGSTATLANRELGTRLRWAKGYSVESVSVRAIWDVRMYVRNQPAHHPDQAIVGWGAASLHDASG